MATKREVEGKLRELMGRLAAAEQVHGTLSEGLPDGKVLAVRVTDLDAEYWTVMDRGTMGGLHPGSPERADRGGMDERAQDRDPRGVAGGARRAARA